MVEAVEQYLRGLELKRCVFGGVDEEDVLLHIKRICELWEDGLEEAQKKAEADKKEVSRAKEALETQKKAVSELQSELRRARSEIQRLEGEKAQAESGQAVALELKGQYEQEYQGFYEVMETIQGIKKDAAVKAQIEAAKEAAKLRSEIMAKANEKRQEIEGEILKLQQEIEQLQNRREAVRHMAKVEAENCIARIQQMGNSLDILRGQAESLGGSEPARGDYPTQNSLEGGGSVHAG